jgi:hypothetical protein
MATLLLDSTTYDTDAGERLIDVLNGITKETSHR